MTNKEFLDQIISSLDNEPDKWEESSNRIEKKTTERYPTNERRLEIWIDGAPFFIKICKPVVYNPGFIGKIRLWLAINRWKRRKASIALVGDKGVLDRLASGT